MIHTESIRYREKCVRELATQTDALPDYAEKISAEVDMLTHDYGLGFFLDLFRISANIPECIRKDSSEEKRYSKFTDTLLSYALSLLGLTSTILDTRTDSADVAAEIGNPAISLVGDAKAFRLSRTAKNQKDFKIPALDKWKRGRSYALLVCPLFQLPTKNSQIYYQAIERRVCILSYSHMCALIRLASVDKLSAVVLFKDILNATSSVSPTTSAAVYWDCIHSVLLSNELVEDFWTEEKQLVHYAIELGKEEALTHLGQELQRIGSLSKEEAIEELISLLGINAKIKAISMIKIKDNVLTK